MKKYLLIFLSILSVVFFGNLTSPTNDLEVEETTSVAEVLVNLGDSSSYAKPDNHIRGVFAERGKAIVLTGIAPRPKRGKTGKQSKHFVCTACHNVVRDEPDLSVVDPQARLIYSKENGLPYLQGSTLYGAVNRSSFYNGDYEKKYGDLVLKTRHNLREAIQLCATECSQGRRLKDWELESVLAYLWTIDLKVGDLNLAEWEMQNIKDALESGKKKPAAIALIKSHYLQGEPATFLDPPKDRKMGYSKKGDPENGKLIYELSCLHCHKNKRYSFFNLDNSNYSFQFLEKHFPTYSRYSVYQVARYGTSPVPWKRAYMPNYTKEKMSNDMLEDLRVYIEQKAWHQ